MDGSEEEIVGNAPRAAFEFLTTDYADVTERGPGARTCWPEPWLRQIRVIREVRGEVRAQTTAGPTAANNGLGPLSDPAFGLVSALANQQTTA